MPSPRLDTSCHNLESDKGVRSPRTPTYGPDSPSTGSVPPFDAARYFVHHDPDDDDRQSVSLLPPPPQSEPLPWVWICHLCHSRYPLGVTRRCLVDGHYYCSGQTDRPSLRKKKKPRACSCEFDYAAWKAWGTWRRAVLRTLKSEVVARGCECCDFPSQCRYPANSHPLGSAEFKLVFPDETISCPLPKSDSKTSGSKASGGERSKANENVDFDQILENIYSDAMSRIPEPQTPANTKQKEKGLSKGKKKRSGKAPTPSLDDELSEEESRLRELIGPNLWACLEDIGLDNAPAE
ncbi:hypothetical protein AYO20_09872 [Fonsecaea nubica]|uniref:Uncharacterized protein n=1 Tax=Fonsecaea nubica TaxID=856822 RepID=A0A178CCH2_9EURO|nr:hypothetical protein AYO20_09872 [Fonsecaea nubica]OAL27064.1 hypothetical protein AYO20_09872 [Fonsecaea nubica]